jgi:serine/threonine-protein kinase
MPNVNSDVPPNSIPVSLGEVLAGKYRIDRILGAGGMGVVCAATHMHLDQRVALKFMLPEGLAHPSLVERFSREARAAVRLKSDHVARVLDVGTLESGSPYMVMEFLEGNDLGTLVEQSGRFPIETAVDFVLQACDAVAEAHSLGIVHRDLKPRNLFLTQRNDGRALVKVLDFGISKMSTGSDLSLTRTTEVIGSPNYMSPEQLKSAKSVDERSDIWALGIILYELLTGTVPFVAESVTQLTAMVLTDEPRPPDKIRPEVPAPLVRIVLHCLEKEPAKRFSNVGELAVELARFAPHDTRELADRIRRISSGSRLSVAPPSSASSWGRVLQVPGSTAVSWSGRTELAGKSRAPRIAIFAGLGVIALTALGAGAFFAFRRSPPPLPPAAAAAPKSAAPAPVATISVAAGTAATTATATTTESTAAIANAPSSANGAQTESTPATTAATTKVAAPSPSPSTKPSAAKGDEPPKYRTSW